MFRFLKEGICGISVQTYPLPRFSNGWFDAINPGKNRTKGGTDYRKHRLRKKEHIETYI